MSQSAASGRATPTSAPSTPSAAERATSSLALTPHNYVFEYGMIFALIEMVYALNGFILTLVPVGACVLHSNHYRECHEFRPQAAAVPLIALTVTVLGFLLHTSFIFVIWIYPDHCDVTFYRIRAGGFVVIWGANAILMVTAYAIHRKQNPYEKSVIYTRPMVKWRALIAFFISLTILSAIELFAVWKKPEYSGQPHSEEGRCKKSIAITAEQRLALLKKKKKHDDPQNGENYNAERLWQKVFRERMGEQK